MLYSLAYINKLSPYEVFEYEENVVCFFTDDGSEYLIGFIEETNIGFENAYQLFITRRKNGHSKGADEKIGRTVSAVVSSFFRNNLRILIYICDTSDKRQAARDRKFKSWYHQYASFNDLKMISEVIEIDEDAYFASMILSLKMTGYEEMENRFHGYFQDLRAK